MFYAPSTKGFYSREIHGDRMPVDAVEISDALYQVAKGQQIETGPDGLPRLKVAAAPTLPERIAVLLRAVDGRLNDAAKAKGYDDIRSAALRAAYPGPYHDEGVMFAQWMDATSAKCYELLGAFQAGNLEEPSAKELLAMLPEAPQ